MNLKLTISPKAVDGVVPESKILSEAAAYGMEVCVRDHLRDKNRRTTPNPHGLPKSNYYAEVADTVRSSHHDAKATVEIGPDDDSGPGNGIALHYHGGTVYPKKKALAIPVSPLVAGIWPSEHAGVNGGTELVWPKGSNTGFIKDVATDAILWLLVPKATIPADPTVIPDDASIISAAESAVMSLLEAS